MYIQKQERNTTQLQTNVIARDSPNTRQRKINIACQRRKKKKKKKRKGWEKLRVAFKFRGSGTSFQPFSPGNSNAVQNIRSNPRHDSFATVHRPPSPHWESLTSRRWCVQMYTNVYNVYKFGSSSVIDKHALQIER